MAGPAGDRSSRFVRTAPRRSEESTGTGWAGRTGHGAGGRYLHVHEPVFLDVDRLREACDAVVGRRPRARGVRPVGLGPRPAVGLVRRTGEAVGREGVRLVGARACHRT